MTEQRDWRRLFIHVLLYYLVLLLGLLGLLFFVPALEPYLPVGGMDALTGGTTFEEVVSTYREVASSEKVFRGVYRLLIIQNSIALAFGLAGIVAGVQYRNRLALSVDAAYLFAALAGSMAEPACRTADPG